MNISKPILSYKSNEMNVSPHATLAGRNQSFLLSFFNDTLIVDPTISSVEYYCKVEEVNRYFVAFKINERQLNCTVPYLNLTKISISAIIRVPSISDDYLRVSKNLNFVCYIKQEIVKIQQNPLFYVGEMTDVVSLFISTEMDSSLLDYVKCSLNISETYLSTTKFSFNGNNSYTFNCTYSTSTPGKIRAYLEYSEGTTMFSITDLESSLIDFVFTGKFAVSSISPLVGITNVTNNVRMISNFPSRDYGIVTYISKFGFQSNPYQNQTIETNYTIVGDKFEFSTIFNILNPSTYSLSVWMMLNGKQLEILSPVLYKFIGKHSPII
jgi:hypothetical protein